MLSHCCALLETTLCQKEGLGGQGRLAGTQGLGCPAAVLPQAVPRLFLSQPADQLSPDSPLPA